MSRLADAVRFLYRVATHRRAVTELLETRVQRDRLGSLSESEWGRLEVLVEKANRVEGPIVEIGALFGFTTQRLADWKDNDKTVLCVENYSWNPLGLSPRDHRSLLEGALFYVTENERVDIVGRDSSDFYNSYDGPRPSLVFIDASHDYQTVRSDIEWAQAQNVPVICGHDYGRQWPGVKRAVTEFFGDDVTVAETLWSVSNIN